MTTPAPKTCDDCGDELYLDAPHRRLPALWRTSEEAHPDKAHTAYCRRYALHVPNRDIEIPLEYRDDPAPTGDGVVSAGG